jgi:hypothetical protein
MATNGNCATCEKSGICAQHHVLHIVVKIFIALFIFWCGIQFGEVRSMLRAASYGTYGYGMMGAYGERNRVYVAPAMMSGWSTNTALPATTTKPSTKK